MSRVKLIFGTYNAVPSGETDSFFEEAYQKAFKPFLTSVYNHPEMKPTLFYAGPLLEWLNRQHPEFHTVLAELISNKSLEILGGGYWEPMLPLIPSSDRIGQIELMTTYLRKKFGKRSRGGWISGQVWEPHLASSFRSSGMDYIFLAERAFPPVSGGCPDSPAIVEDQGKTVTVFPLRDSLGGRFLTASPEDVLGALRNLQPTSEKEVVVSIIVDGLSLGGRGSYDVCYKERWLERFFEAVEGSRDWLECVHPGRYLRSTRVPRNKVCIPGPTYKSLMQWTGPRPADAKENEGENPSFPAKPQTFYRDFLTKYRESNFLYAKMMHIEVLTNQLRGDRSRKKNAKEELWRGQEHYAYWHGPSGGIYNHRLRHAAYTALIEAEKATRERGIFKSALTAVDFDMDGDLEFLYSGLTFNAYVHTVGGALFELDYIPVSRNYLATFAHYPEDYHPPETQGKGYCDHPRQAFLDHIIHPDDSLESFQGSPQKPPGPYLGKIYTPLDVVRDQAKVLLSCRGPVYQSREELEIRKCYHFRRSVLEVEYVLTNLTQSSLRFSWGSEINLALPDNPEMRTVSLGSGEEEVEASSDRGMDNNIDFWTIHDGERDVAMRFSVSPTAHLWRFPVCADYRVGGELRRGYQSSFFMPKWDVEIPPMDSCSFRISMKIGRYKKQRNPRPT